MATKKVGGLTRDERKGLYVRSLGWSWQDGCCKQPKFYLGRDKSEAERRNLRLEQLWRCVVEKWEKGPALETTLLGDIVLWQKGERGLGRRPPRGGPSRRTRRFGLPGAPPAGALPGRPRHRALPPDG